MQVVSIRAVSVEDEHEEAPPLRVLDGSWTTAIEIRKHGLEHNFADEALEMVSASF
jgi:hypothetical protein